jgi:hypothetical protein
VAVLCVIALFASGGLLSAGKLDYAWILTTHRVGLAALVVVLGAVGILISLVTEVGGDVLKWPARPNKSLCNFV